MLVVNADDLGLSESVDRAILRAHRDGVVRSTSLLVTFPRAEEAAALARAERRLEVGLHIDLVEGTPASDPASVRTLVDRDGRFLGLRELLTRLASARVRPAELATEIRAQVARARALGTPALAWDSHRHVHLFPLVAQVVGGVAREQGARWIRRGAPAGWPGAWKACMCDGCPRMKKDPGHRPGSSRCSLLHRRSSSRPMTSWYRSGLLRCR